MDHLLHPSDTVDLSRVARLVRPFETLELQAVRRPGGGWSIGYGHVSSAREGAKVTRDEAEALLIYDLRQAARGVRSAIYAPINRNQLEALIAFAFHIGAKNFLHSTALHRFNAGDSLGAAQELERWCRADLGGEAQIVDALVRRRAAEKAHFLTPPEGFPKVSRARLPPQADSTTVATEPPSAEAAPSAALAAAHSVSARLRALVPDAADEDEDRPPAVELEHARPAPIELEPVEPEPVQPGPGEPELVEPERVEPERVEPEPIEPEAVASAPSEPEPVLITPGPIAPKPIKLETAESQSAPEPSMAAAPLAFAAAASELFEAFARPDSEIPPPPMPHEVAEAAVDHAAWSEPSPARPRPTESVAFDVWPAIAPAEGGAGDPFAAGPLDGASIEAPGQDQAPLDANLFRARSEPSVSPAPSRQPLSQSKPLAQGKPLAQSKPPSKSRTGTTLSLALLWICLAIGAAAFAWAIWSIFKTTPGLANFGAGLVGIALMAVPAYLLLGAKPAPSNQKHPAN